MIGIFGGRFDPIHRAHVAMAKAAADQLQLQEVLWVVSANAVHKSIVAGAEHRLEMVRLALEELGDPRMKIDEREIHAAARGEDNPSFKTLQSLQEERPNQEWVWILGEDQLQAFTSWQRWDWLAQNMALAVCRRPGGIQTTDLTSGRPDQPNRPDESSGVSPAEDTTGWRACHPNQSPGRRSIVESGSGKYFRRPADSNPGAAKCRQLPCGPHGV